MADKGKAFSMVSGAGDVFGAFVIESLNETGTIFVQEGRPRRIEFDLNLARVDDDRAEGSGGVDPWPADDYWDWWLWE